MQEIMKILHTSDWHLGRALYGRKRHEEFAKFLGWMIETISQEKVDLLLIAGDIFDTTTPSNWAQNLYYQFLTDVQKTECSNIVITAGNHDSATFLEAPAGILKTMNVHVVGQIDDTPEKEIITITAPDGTPKAIICAVPYLRERDIRTASPGETVDEKSIKLVQGIEKHYNTVVTAADAIRQQNGIDTPIIAMGHLFAAGGKSVTGDGVRELYVGSLAHVPASVFPPQIAYLALGHLHSSQKVAGQDHLRYCGSPIPMSFSEAKRPKSVVTFSCDDKVSEISTIEVPAFQRLESLSGNIDELLEAIEQLRRENCSIWLEIQYNGDDLVATLQERLKEATTGTQLEILRIINTRIISNVLHQDTTTETLEDLSVTEVFNRCLAVNNISGGLHDELSLRFNQIVDALDQDEPPLS